MRYLAVGDIHGCYTALAALAAFVPFQPDDVIITLGDYVNRGPDSRQVLDWLIAQDRRGNLVALRGNHEIMMLEARDSQEIYKGWMEYGGNETLASYAPEGRVPDEHWRFLEEETRAYFEIPTHFFVHASVYPDIPLRDQPDFMLYWERFADPPPHQSGKIMVCGHTSQKSGLPRNIGHAVCIDTFVYGDGWLTCLDVANGQYWQANQKGETRGDRLSTEQ